MMILTYYAAMPYTYTYHNNSLCILIVCHMHEYILLLYNLSLYAIYTIHHVPCLLYIYN